MEKAAYERDIRLLTEKMSARTPVLVLGAGFSLGTKNGDEKLLPSATKLANELFDRLLAKNRKISADDMKEYQQERDDLLKTCDTLKFEGLHEERDKYLTRRFSGCHCTTDDYHMLLRCYPWRYIFTLNIDDLVEFIYSDLPQRERPLIHVRQSSTLDSNASLEVFKPHGSVKRSDLGYIFDSEEYRDLIATSSWTMQHFSDLFLTNDVIFLGTEFQEADFHIMIQKHLNLIEIRQPFHYFFVSPLLNNRELRRAVERSSNIHYIPWTAEKLLKYIKNHVTDIDDVRRKMRDYGMVFYDEKQQEAMPQMARYLSELYLGAPPRPIDFFRDVDIIRPELVGKAAAIAAKGGRQLIIFSGIAYVGKTCAAIRLGVNLMAQGYEFSTFHLSYSMNARIYESLILEYLGSLPQGSKIAILSENMPYYYSRIKHILEKCPDNINSLVIICTANIQDHNSKKYLLDQWKDLEEIFISEKTSERRMADAIYDKLESTNHLNKLLTYGSTRKERITEIRQLNDLIEVLYVSQEGRGFISHFSEWIGDQVDDASKESFLLLCCLAQLGVPNLTKPLFQDILLGCGIQIDLPAFLAAYADLIRIENGKIQLRCSRLLWASAQQQLDEVRILRWIKTLVVLLARNLREHEETIQNEIFQKLIKTKYLPKQLCIPIEHVMDLLIELEQPCKHLSYYWVQRGICHRELTHFEEANNALLAAANIRNNTSFNVKHAQAKNYMTWGVWAIEHQPSHAVYFFDLGKELLEKLIRTAPDQYYAYSTHTYVDMMVHFHRASKAPICDEELKTISVLLQRLLGGYGDSLATQIVKDFLDYCIHIGSELTAVQDLRELYYTQHRYYSFGNEPGGYTFDSDDIDA